MHQEKTSPLKIYLAWALAGLFFLYQYILRVSPGIMAVDLRQFYGISAEQFSLFGAFTLYAYGLLQIPIGIMLDRFGVKNTIVVSLLVCILGNTAMALSDSLYVGYFARILIGAGTACTFISCLKIVSDHLPQGKRGLLMGATLGMGTIGALLGGPPQSYLIDQIGWRQTLLFASMAGAVVWLLIVFLMPRLQGPTKAKVSSTDIFCDIRHILSNRRVMVYALLAIGLYTPLSAVADLWGVSFLMEKYHIARETASGAIINVYLGLCVGSFVTPWIFESMNRLNLGIQLGCFFVACVFSLILFAPLNLLQMKLCLFALGFLCGAEMMCFTGVAQECPAGKAGTSLGLANTLNMVGGAVFQQFMGFIIDYFWDGRVSETGLRLYSVDDYTFGLCALLAMAIICFMISLTLKQRPHHPNFSKAISQ